MQEELFDNTRNLDVLCAPVEDLIIENGYTDNNNKTIVDCKGIILSKKLFYLKLDLLNILF